MTKLEDVILTPDVASSRPAAGAVPIGAVYFATDTGILTRSNGSTWDDYGPAGVLPDPSGEPDDYVLLVATGAAVWGPDPGGGGGGGGAELDYVPRTTDLTVTATTQGAAQTWITGGSVAYSGSTRIKVECWCQLVDYNQSGFAIIDLYEDSTHLGRIGQIGDSSGVTFKGETFLTPAAGSHVYTLKTWITGVSTAVLYAASASTALAAFLRITEA